MINRETLNAIYPIVEKLDATSNLLIPSEVSPVFALNEVAMTPIVDMHEGETGFEEAWLESLQRSPVLGAIGANETETDAGTQVTINLSMYSRTLEEGAEMLAMSVRNAMKHARTVASPTVSNMIDMMNEYMEDVTVIPEPYEIVDVSLAPVWDNPVVMSALEKHQTKIRSLDRSSIRRVAAPEDLDEHLVTGAVAFDQAFQQSLRDAGMTAQEVFDYLFNGSKALSGVEYPFYKTRNKTIIAYLMASILLDKPVANSGMDSIEWETTLQSMLNVLGEGCNFIYQTHQSDIDANVLHYDTDMVNGKVYLNSVIYDKWLNEGGTPEVIFGAVMNQQHNPSEIISYTQTLDRKEILMNVWSNYHASKRILEDNKRLDKIKNGLYACLVKTIDEMDSADLPELAVKDNLVTRAKEHVAQVNNHHINDMGKLCLDIACDVLFYHTPAKYLLNRITDRCEEGMSADEAATAVMMEYVTDWIALGLGVVKQG